ncbi:hypothetical protein PF005_g27435 [Phytophthora fragariae]|uniref:Secreted protein n=1 Tax=Phytophthora fragariae TaxID=53985 RepID=A0A6A3HT92_9STRA|nr:hypothetical protein PF003_g37469 [Phytophthora fragariae]KAE8917316.1 hypothetical protein PF009_g32362 [Phytophthora fragariae]KAE8971905.1 hypothetical protein PF011_g25854 [Phytophthora fragariae]KAE9056599.1 hypothetical protein PF007_g31938 [Phytophthora fragariae]KAE9057880.1 hypothetical protein PF006_g32302 [Phytophthora fragariae]
MHLAWQFWFGHFVSLAYGYIVCNTVLTRGPRIQDAPGLGGHLGVGAIGRLETEVPEFASHDQVVHPATQHQTAMHIFRGLRN